MSKWSNVKLSTVASVQTGPFGSQLHQDDYVDVGTPIITVKHIDNNRILHEDTPYVSDDDKKRLSKYSLLEGDIVFSRVGAVDRCAYVSKAEEGWLFSGRCLRIRVNKQKLDSRYLMFYFSHPVFKSYIQNIAVRATMPSLNTKIMNDIEFHLPPLSEQKEIVAILDKLFAKIDKAKANLEKNIENVDELFQRKLYDVFSQTGDGWENSTLNDLCSIIKDGTHQTPQYFDSGYIFLSSRNVTSGVINWDDVKYIDEVQHNELSMRVAPKKGDILLAKNGTTGIGAIVDRDEIFDIYVSLALLRPREVVDGAYLLYFINSPFAKKQFNKRLKGIGVPNLHLKEIKEVVVNYPTSKEEQKAIVAALDELKTKTDTLKDIYKQKLLGLEEMRKTVLEMAFRGELV